MTSPTPRDWEKEKRIAEENLKRFSPYDVEHEHAETVLELIAEVERLRASCEAMEEGNRLAVAIAADADRDLDALNEQLSQLKAERDTTKRDSFAHGYLIAVANLMNLHGSEVEAEDVLGELGETEGVIKRLDLTDYDAQPLRKLFREISRKRRSALNTGES